jgi:hypothetical protein
MVIISLKFKAFFCTLDIVIKLRINLNSQIFLEFKSISRTRSGFDFSFQIDCHKVQVINMKVCPNELIFLLEKIHNF